MMFWKEASHTMVVVPVVEELAFFSYLGHEDAPALMAMAQAARIMWRIFS